MRISDWSSDVCSSDLGLGDEARGGDAELADDLLALMHSAQVDFTSGFRSLSAVVRGDREPARTIFGATEAFDEWCARWLQRQTVTSLDSEAIAASLDHANPVYIPDRKSTRLNSSH